MAQQLETPVIEQVLDVAPHAGEEIVDAERFRAVCELKDPVIKFKPATPDTPSVWREADADRPTVH